MISTSATLGRCGRTVAVAMALVIGLAAPMLAQTGGPPPKTEATPYVVEYYYKVKWGYADEFLRLFKKNHYPLLKKQTESGRFLKVTAVKPRYHGTEDGRWDYRVTIVFKNLAAAHDAAEEAALIRQLYPDQETYRREEQRRFEILLAHWDLPLTDLALDE
jgi:hypothetical protein